MGMYSGRGGTGNRRASLPASPANACHLSRLSSRYSAHAQGVSATHWGKFTGRYCQRLDLLVTSCLILLTMMQWMINRSQAIIIRKMQALQ